MFKDRYMSKGFKKFLSVVYFILGILCVLATLKLIFDMLVSGQTLGELMSIEVLKKFVIGILGSILFIWYGIILRNRSKS